jgi:hypothetical protein
MAETKGSTPKTPSPDKRPRDEEEQSQEQSPAKKRKVEKARKEDKGKKKRANTTQSGKILLPPKVYPDIFFLFCKPGEKRGKGVLPWKDFLKLMVNIGFSASPAGGSKWQFRPAEKDLRNNIPAKKRGVFRIDEPHPETTLRFVTTRAIGDNLHVRYGWTFETFGERR